jgi:hypothetical protein
MPSLSYPIIHGTSKHDKNWTLISLLSQLKQYRLDIKAQKKKIGGHCLEGHITDARNGGHKRNIEKNGGD